MGCALLACQGPNVGASSSFGESLPDVAGVPGSVSGEVPASTGEPMGSAGETGEDSTAGASSGTTAGTTSPLRRYLTKEQPNLAETFACIAQVGLGGRDGLGEALASAVSPALVGPGGRNEGFLRNDALLMVTFVMGGYDSASHGTPEEWSQAVLDAMHGDPGAIVMFGFFAPNCAEDENDRLCQMLLDFPYWKVESNLVEDYGPAFESATEMVASACSELIPA